jgi:HEPN domain-containing protein
MARSPEEWFAQARYDVKTAEWLLSGRRHHYAIFMCHLSLEKALKGLCHKLEGKTPPKTHDLLYLVQRTRLSPPAKTTEGLARINELSVPTRYPDELKKMQRVFTARRTQDILAETREALKWLRREFSKL